MGKKTRKASRPVRPELLAPKLDACFSCAYLIATVILRLLSTTNHQMVFIGLKVRRQKPRLGVPFPAAGSRERGRSIRSSTATRSGPLQGRLAGVDVLVVLHLDSTDSGETVSIVSSGGGGGGGTCSRQKIEGEADDEDEQVAGGQNCDTVRK